MMEERRKHVSDEEMAIIAYGFTELGVLQGALAYYIGANIDNYPIELRNSAKMVHAVLKRHKQIIMDAVDACLAGEYKDERV